MKELVLRRAQSADVKAVAESLLKIIQELKQTKSDPYINGLPARVDETILHYVENIIADKDSMVLIAESGGQICGCISGEISSSSMPPAYRKKTGHIISCWVEPDFRKHGIAAKLVSELEKWFLKRKITRVELSYLAQNELAKEVWAKLGYQPFRVFSHKELGGFE